MDFNSNDEYLKAFPPNFGPKFESRNMLDQLPVFDLQAHKVLPKNQHDNIEETYTNEMNEHASLYEELECVEVQETIQVSTPVNNVEKKDDEVLKAHELLTLCEEDSASTKDKPNLVQSKIILEPLLKGVDITPVMEVQRESDGEPIVETALPLHTIMKATVLDDGETSIISDTHVEAPSPPPPSSALEIMQETTIHGEMIPAEEIDAIATGGIKDSKTLALDRNIGHYEAGNPCSEAEEEAMERVATVKDHETSVGFLPPLREFAIVEGTQIFAEQESRPITGIDTAEGIYTMNVTEPLQDVQSEQPAETLITFVEDTMTTTETDNSETQEPGTVEMIETTTTVTAAYETQTSQTELTEHTQIEESDEVLGTEEEDATMTVEITTEKATVIAKAVCPFEGEEEELSPFAVARTGVPSSSNSTTGLSLEDLGMCSDAEVDKIVDSIMNDIADIEADMEIENAEVETEADMESNTRQHQKLEIYGTSVEIESTTICQDYIQCTGSQV